MVINWSSTPRGRAAACLALFASCSLLSTALVPRELIHTRAAELRRRVLEKRRQNRPQIPRPPDPEGLR
jgi:hypothetical protein